MGTETDPFAEYLAFLVKRGYLTPLQAMGAYQTGPLRRTVGASDD